VRMFGRVSEKVGAMLSRCRYRSCPERNVRARRGRIYYINTSGTDDGSGASAGNVISARPPAEPPDSEPIFVNKFGAESSENRNVPRQYVVVVAQSPAAAAVRFADGLLTYQQNRYRARSKYRTLFVNVDRAKYFFRVIPANRNVEFNRTRFPFVRFLFVTTRDDFYVVKYASGEFIRRITAPTNKSGKKINVKRSFTLESCVIGVSVLVQVIRAGYKNDSLVQYVINVSTFFSSRLREGEGG